MAHTDWCILTITNTGDIIDVDMRATKPSAAIAIDRADPLPAGWMYAIEGRRITSDERSLFKRTGIVRKFGNPSARVASTWEVIDAKWYESGDEPDFAVRS